MSMVKSFYDRNVLENVFYGDKSQLLTRIDVWNKYGISKQNYDDFLMSIIDYRRYNGFIDIGCGNARYSSNFLKCVEGNAYFCDISRSLLEEAKIITAKAMHSCKLFFINEDISNVNILPNSCELISLMHVLHHIDDIDSLFDKIDIIAKPNAAIMITTYNHSMTDFLNMVHYEAIKELGFPHYMLDKEQYLKFNGNKAYEYLKRRYRSKVKKFDYYNDAIIKETQIFMDYYASATMFRMSKGYYSTDITKKQWERLYTYVKDKAEEEIKKNGQIVLEGHLTAFLIQLEG